MALLEAKNVGISFGGLRAVDQFNIEIEAGDLQGLIGPNGAGKTTIFNMLTGVYKPTDGDIILDGVSMVGRTPADICRHGIARTFQNIRLFSRMSVLDNVKVALHNQVKYSLAESLLHLGGYKGRESDMDQRALSILSEFKLEDYAGWTAGNLPYGQQRKLEIARALATNPKLLLLDEPAAGMNPSETQELMETIAHIRNQFHVTVLLIEHDMSLVLGICEKITVLDYGRVIARGDKSVVNDPKVVAAYLGE